MDIVFLIAGLILLVAGGEGLVRGGVQLAQRLGLSKAFIGTVLLGFGTSMPEFVATFLGAAQGADGIAFGNVLGSNIANILMILGLSAVICPLALPTSGLRRDALFVMISTLGICLWIGIGALPIWGGAALVTVFIAYMVLAIRSSGGEEPGDIVTVTTSPLVGIVMAIAGIGALIVGADFLIRGGSNLARSWGVSEALIGITIVGVGTSLPEAVTSIIASFKRENALAFANIIGSNIFNGLAILGGTALIYPLNLTGAFTVWDGLALLLATLAMFAFALTRAKMSRAEGGIMLLGYVAYLGWLITQASA